MCQRPKCVDLTTHSISKTAAVVGCSRSTVVLQIAIEVNADSYRKVLAYTVQYNLGVGRIATDHSASEAVLTDVQEHNLLKL